MPFRLFALFLLTALVAVACDDATEKNRTALIGHWELTKALRNQRETGLLANIFFDFEPDGKMLTNLPVAPEPSATDYEVANDEIVQQLPQPLHYRIQTLNDSVLVLGLEMRSIPFELQLRRAEKPVPVPVEEGEEGEMEQDSLTEQ